MHKYYVKYKDSRLKTARGVSLTNEYVYMQTFTIMDKVLQHIILRKSEENKYKCKWCYLFFTSFQNKIVAFLMTH